MIILFFEDKIIVATVNLFFGKRLYIVLNRGGVYSSLYDSASLESAFLHGKITLYAKISYEYRLFYNYSPSSAVNHSVLPPDKFNENHPIDSITDCKIAHD